MNFITFCSFFFAILSQADSLKLEKVWQGEDVVWGFDFLKDTEALVTQRDGKMFLVDLSKGSARIITGLPAVEVDGQGGLLDIKVDPEFPKNQRVFFTYAHREGKSGITTRLASARFDRASSSLKEIKVLFTALPVLKGDKHFGARIAFDGKGMLFLAIGDRDERNRSQDTQAHMGKVIRLSLEGKVPEDNPYGPKGAAPAKGLKEIWSLGHRNPQGIAFDSQKEILWVSEHGPRGGDELNRIEPGRNYGWPLVTAGREYWGPSIGIKKKEGMVDPVRFWVPSIAPASLMIYSGKLYGPWKGAFLQPCLAGQHLNVVQPVNGMPTGPESRHFDGSERFRHIAENSQGVIYLGADSGVLYRVVFP
jgi:aldose sugar dehydrogenase